MSGCTFDTVIQKYDVPSEFVPFTIHDVWRDLHELVRGIDAETLPVDTRADLLAFQIELTDYSGNDLIHDWLPPLLSSEVVTHWQYRLDNCSSFYLKYTFANLIFKYAPSVGIKCDFDIIRASIFSAFAINRLELYEERMVARTTAHRALDVSIKVNNPDFIQRAVTNLLDAEARIAEDTSPGLWGFAFEHLTTTKKMHHTEAQHAFIFGELQERFKRFSTQENFYMWGVQCAFERLLAYFRRVGLKDDEKFLILEYGKAVLYDASKSPALKAVHSLQKLYELYGDMGLMDAARSIEPLMSQYGQASFGEMEEHTFTYEVTKDQMDSFLALFDDENMEVSFLRLVMGELPDDEQKFKEQASKITSISDLVTRFSLDSRGTIIGHNFSGENDTNNKILEDYNQFLAINAPWLQWALDHVFQLHSVNTEVLLEHVYQSYLFRPEKKEIFRMGFDAYFCGNYIVAAHLLIPQIEDCVREFARTLGVRTLEVDSHNGGNQYRSLGSLLREPDLRVPFRANGDRIFYYLQAVLTEKLGWNLRNDLCHGNMSADQIARAKVDRIIHIILLLSFTRQVQSEEPEA